MTRRSHPNTWGPRCTASVQSAPARQPRRAPASLRQAALQAAQRRGTVLQPAQTGQMAVAGVEGRRRRACFGAIACRVMCPLSCIVEAAGCPWFFADFMTSRKHRSSGIPPDRRAARSRSPFAYCHLPSGTCMPRPRTRKSYACVASRLYDHSAPASAAAAHASETGRSR